MFIQFIRVNKTPFMYIVCILPFTTFIWRNKHNKNILFGWGSIGWGWGAKVSSQAQWVAPPWLWSVDLYRGVSDQYHGTQYVCIDLCTFVLPPSDEQLTRRTRHCSMWTNHKGPFTLNAINPHENISHCFKHKALANPLGTCAPNQFFFQFHVVYGGKWPK